MNENKNTLIIVNGREQTHQGKMITYKEVVIYAFNSYIEDGNTSYTVIYTDKHEKKEGTMVLGDSVKAKKEMIFNVTRTNKS